ncbi:hypothetical protein F5Y17DRAFT_461541 [Xylariaceae sp. FL0594]|nr:hypothetical protein F5Y17DRAFT_461541 [Xylariaceae sp. FL0594]
MKRVLSALASVAASIMWSGVVHAHAVLQAPVPRGVERCGELVTEVLERDRAGPIENAVKAAATDSDYNCDAYLCRGYQYEDNVDRNVSVVDLARNKMIGEPLVYWANWPDAASGPPRNDTDFTVTIPDLNNTPGMQICDEGGRCVIQWYWWSGSNAQTYESCVDFYVVD